MKAYHALLRELVLSTCFHVSSCTSSTAPTFASSTVESSVVVIKTEEAVEIAADIGTKVAFGILPEAQIESFVGIEESIAN